MELPTGAHLQESFEGPSVVVYGPEWHRLRQKTASAAGAITLEQVTTEESQAATHFSPDAAGESQFAHTD